MRRSSLVAGIAAVALFSVAAVAAQADDYVVTGQDFESVALGTSAQSLFDSKYITVSYAFRDSESDPWQIDNSFPLNIESNGSNVLGDGGGAIIFSLQPNMTFNEFAIDVVPTGSPFASTTAEYYFQSMTGVVTKNIFDETVSQTLSLTGSIPSDTSAIIVPIDAQYDNLSLKASGVVVPEAGTLSLLASGLLTLVGSTVLLRRSAKKN